MSVGECQCGCGFPIGPAAADLENYRGCGMLLTKPTCKVQYLYRQLRHQLRFTASEVLLVVFTIANVVREPTVASAFLRIIRTASGRVWVTETPSLS
jgi:hypothetical protein